MNYANIKYNDISNGLGIRTSLFVSGCRHHCKGCFNTEAWDFCFGKVYDEVAEKEILDSMEAYYISGLSLLGGEPLDPNNQKDVLGLLQNFKKRYPNKNVWCYTGYTYDTDFKERALAYTPYIEEILSYIDVLVDGKFEEDLYDISLKFRGSSNQRLIDMKESRRVGEVCLLALK